MLTCLALHHHPSASCSTLHHLGVRCWSPVCHSLNLCLCQSQINDPCRQKFTVASHKCTPRIQGQALWQPVMQLHRGMETNTDKPATSRCTLCEIQEAKWNSIRLATSVLTYLEVPPVYKVDVPSGIRCMFEGAASLPEIETSPGSCHCWCSLSLAMSLCRCNDSNRFLRPPAQHML